MGGDCLNYGCVPSKSLIAAARRAHLMRTSAPFGIVPTNPTISYKGVHDHIHGVIAAIAPNDSAERFTGLGVNGDPRHGPVHQPRHGAGRRPAHQGAALRHRHRLLAGGSAHPGARGRALFHQRDHLREQGPARPPDRHRRRSDRAGAGPGLFAPGQPRHRAGGHEGARQGRSGNVRGRAEAPARRGRGDPRGRAGRARRRRDAADRRAHLGRGRAGHRAGHAPARRHGAHAQRGEPQPRGRQHQVRQARHPGEQGPRHLELEGVRHRRRHRRPAVHARRQLSRRHRPAPGPVPPAGDGRWRHHPLGDVHRSRARPRGAHRGRGEKAQRARAGLPLALPRERPRPGRAGGGRLRQGRDRRQGPDPGRQHRRRACRRADPDVVACRIPEAQYQGHDAMDFTLSDVFRDQQACRLRLLCDGGR